MDRRGFLQLMGTAGLAVSTGWSPRAATADDEPYSGPFFVTVAAEGGWDVTSFCDPKLNLPGEPVINNWARTRDLEQTGNIRYAPVAQNKHFFERFRDHMLVVNGIDAQTNSHDAGVIHNWSGRLALGYPSFTALAAAAYGPDLPLAMINNGGYKETAGLVRYTLLHNPDVLRQLVRPNQAPWDPSRSYFYAQDMDRIRRYRQQRLLAMQQRTDVIPRQSRGLNHLYLARNSADQLKQFADSLPDQLVSPQDSDGNYFPAPAQAQLALFAYRAGITVGCDLVVYGFDTHDDHDALHQPLLVQLTRTIEFLFDTAEQMGLADRLVVFVTSDFGRTPAYNDTQGKDHWPIGSALIIQYGAPWGNRVVGLTDDGHNALPINPRTLRRDDSGNGITLHPRHVQAAMRRLAGIDGHAVVQRFPLEAEPVGLFDPALQSV